MYEFTEIRYYIAEQDGRYDSREFKTLREAEFAREEIKKYSEMLYKSTYVTYYKKVIWSSN